MCVCACATGILCHEDRAYHILPVLVSGEGWFKVSYWLPYINFSENKWNSRIVEGTTVALWMVPFGTWFPVLFVVQSIYMIPLHLYGGGVYKCLYFLDSHLY
jgi:hypothetical protein